MKKCPYCDEKIQDKAKKCKHCWERLTNLETWEIIECEKTYNPIIKVCRFIIFLILCIIFSYLTFWLIWLLLSLFAMLDPVRLFLWIIFFSWLFIWIWWFLVVWLTYLINKMFLLPINKKLWWIFFRSIYILATIDKLLGLWIYQTRYSNTFRVFFTIILIIVCIVFTVGLGEIIEENK